MEKFEKFKIENYPAKDEYEASKHLPKGGLQIDIGAGVPTWTLKMLEKADEVWAFEPDKRLTKELVEIAKTDKRLTVFPIALSNKCRWTELYIRQYENTGIVEGYHKYNAFKVVPVYTLTLDKVEEECNINRTEVKAIKIDTEGAEHLILEGSIKTLTKHKPMLIIEYHNNMQQIEEITKQLGYIEIFHSHREWLDKEGYNNGIKIYTVK